MPRRYGARPIDERGEANLARRIERERTRRGWSFETLARAMTDAGCQISKAAVYGIEQGDPPRRVTVNELLALAEVFETPVPDLLLPIELVEKQRAQDLIEAIQRSTRSMGQWAVDSFNALSEILTLARDDRELYEYVVYQIEASDKGQYVLDSGDDDDDPIAELALLRLVKANADYWREIQKTAAMWSAYRAGGWSDEDQGKADERLAQLRSLLGVGED